MNKSKFTLSRFALVLFLFLGLIYELAFRRSAGEVSILDGLVVALLAFLTGYYLIRLAKRIVISEDQKL